MLVTVRSAPSFSDSAINTRVSDDTKWALGEISTSDGKFIINDTLWYWVNPKGQLRPCVVNSAKYISTHFQQNLEAKGWHKEELIDNQRIDAYIELHTSVKCHELTKDNFFEFLRKFDDLANAGELAGELQGLELDGVCSALYQKYVKRSIFSIDKLPINLQELFADTAGGSLVRIGVEFETGNIASSFRALTKLNNLYVAGLIDAGVFITSEDKNNCAARIWPVSNRNGSFQELVNRNYLQNILVPLWEYSFKPDGFSDSAPYLGEGLTLYYPKDTGATRVIEGNEYQIWAGEKGQEILKGSV